jgi:hypothetical protein
LDITNNKNASIIFNFCEYMQEKGSSEDHQVNNLKVVIEFARYLGPITFYDVKTHHGILKARGRC